MSDILNYPKNKPAQNGVYPAHIAELTSINQDEDRWEYIEWSGDEWKMHGVRIDRFVNVRINLESMESEE
jgi:hypothetical protein